MSAAASAKHENFVMSTCVTHSASGAAPDRQIDFTHLVGPSGPSLKAPRDAGGQIDLLTVPSHDGADLMVKQVEEALSASSGDRQGLPQGARS